MRRLASWILLAACLWPELGCQWGRLRDPVPASLTASRKLSSEGNELLEQKQPQKAEAKLAEAVRICPTDCDARRYYAETLWLRNARPEAIAQLEEACRLSPEPDFHVRLAEMYLETGRLDAAEQMVDQALNQNGKLAAAWRVRGRVLRAHGDQLLAGNPDLARTVFLEALADLHRAAGYDPSDRQVIAETAAAYRSLGQPQRALECMQSLAEKYSPGEEPPQMVLYWTGLDYMALKRYDDAAATLAAAVARDRPSPELCYRLAEAQYFSGRSREAVAALQQALAIDPQHVPSRQLLGEIQTAQQGGAAMWR